MTRAHRGCEENDCMDMGTCSFVWYPLRNASYLFPIQAKMAMIEKDIKPEELRRTEAHKPESMLVGGLVAIGISLVFLATRVLGGLTAWPMLPGLVLLFIGIALTASYYLTGKLKKEKEQ